MSVWSEVSAQMDEIVDEILGDDVLYSRGGGPFRLLGAFILFVEDSGGDIDELVERPQLKIAKTLVDRPMRADRLRCTAKLGIATYQPAGNTPRDQGRYWLVDLQKVS